MEELIKKYAIGAVLSDSNGHSFETIVEAFSEGECPDGVTIWAPFEHWEYSAMAELIEEQYDIFTNFANELKEN